MTKDGDRLPMSFGASTSARIHARRPSSWRGCAKTRGLTTPSEGAHRLPPKHRVSQRRVDGAVCPRCFRPRRAHLLLPRQKCALAANSNVAPLDPDVADLFPNAAAVNAALRSLAEIARRAGSRRDRPSPGI